MDSGEDVEESTESQARRVRALARLHLEGVPAMADLPVVYDAAVVNPRTPVEIARRAVATCAAAMKAEGLPPAFVQVLVERHGAHRWFSPQEAAFMAEPASSRRDRARFSWGYEALWVFLWALGHVDELEPPTRQCDVPAAVSVMTEQFEMPAETGAPVRSREELLDEADLMYRYHWAVTDAELTGMEAPAGLNARVIEERHRALNWLVGHLGAAWDDVETDF